MWKTVFKKIQAMWRFLSKVVGFWVFVFRGPRPFAWPQPRPPICVYRPGPQFVFTGPGLQLVFTGLGPKFAFKSTTPQFVFTGPGPYLCLPVLTQICIDQPWPRFAFTSPDQNFPTTTATSTITITATSTTTTNTTTATTTIATTTNDNNNNKRCIRGKTRIKWPLKDIWWKSQVLF